MQAFDVLDRSLDIHQHYLLEASAGTGKTFSIQNLIVRLITEGAEPLSLEQILVVTFTRAATRDLKQRIRSNFRDALQHLSQGVTATTPDYLCACLEAGEAVVKEAKKRLQQAMLNFDSAPIFTIHGFCARMLRQYALDGDMGLKSEMEEQPLSILEVKQMLRDVFRTSGAEKAYSPAQAEIYLKEDPEQKKLFRIITSGHEIGDASTLPELYLRFVDAMQALKRDFSLDAQGLIAEFNNQCNAYRSYKKGETKAETLEKITRFSTLFDQTTWSLDDFDILVRDDLVWTQALDPSLLKQKKKGGDAVELRYLGFTERLKRELEPIVAEARAFPFLLARIAKDCRQILNSHHGDEERFSPDALLVKMAAASENVDFADKVSSHYRAVIIDEFQDTDPLQWKIFTRLFKSSHTSWKGNLYLVGDPKQSIYSFRQADLYTYLSAAKSFEQGSRYSLNTNYRSQPNLVLALNGLFSAEHSGALFPLPKQQSVLSHSDVQPSKKRCERLFCDGKGAVHLFFGDVTQMKKASLAEMEKQLYLPFIAREIQYLHRMESLAYNQFAVLVKDRYQAERITDYFAQKGIPVFNQRGTSLAESPALSALMVLLEAVLHPNDHGAVKNALGGCLIGWTQHSLSAAPLQDQILFRFHRLRHALFERGMASFLEEFMHADWLGDGKTSKERMLLRHDGSVLVQDVEQISTLIAEHQGQEWHEPNELIPFLEKITLWQECEDVRAKRIEDPHKNGVKIVTIHSSKGLEFDIVFALGLVFPSNYNEELIPVENAGKTTLIPICRDDSGGTGFYAEADAEKMRQLYVAMTRARDRLYVPVVLNDSLDEQLPGESSAMDLFCKQIKAIDIEDLVSPSHKLLELADLLGKKLSITSSILKFTEEFTEPLIPISEAIPQQLVCPRAVSIPGAPLSMLSFTSLSQYHGSVQDKPRAPQTYDDPVKTIHTLPSNSDTGTLLHSILEKVSFQVFREMQTAADAIPYIRPFILHTPFESWELPIASLVFNTIKTPIELMGRCFCLAKLDPTLIYRELPFLFPYDGKAPLCDGLELSHGLITGVIDLVFMYDDKYYIVDWKTNWLGEETGAYHQDALRQAMKDNNYFLQAALYEEALKRYLQLVEVRPFQECFGGVFYLFLRGLQPEESSGIFFLEKS